MTIPVPEAHPSAPLEALPFDPNHNDGLLMHESHFVILALDAARGIHRDALREVGNNVEDSGGDWAFDDSATRMAAEAAVIKHADVLILEDIEFKASKANPVAYPEENQTTIAPGSRVTVESGGWTDVYDLATHKIKGMPADEAAGVTIISVESPIGAALYGHGAGEEINWKTDNNRSFAGKVVSVDQTAQPRFYAELFGFRLEN